jgi:hypothetical protein
MLEARRGKVAAAGPANVVADIPAAWYAAIGELSLQHQLLPE